MAHMRNAWRDAWKGWWLNAMTGLIVALIALPFLAWGSPAKIESRTDIPILSGGPATACCGAAWMETTTGTTLPSLTVPVAGNADVNCPNTVPTQNQTTTGMQGYANQGRTCATGTNGGGYNVQSISMYIGAATAGTHIMCSVYDSAGPPKNKIAAGCDTASTALAANPTGYVTMPVTGACPLAASTRYWIACMSDNTSIAYGNTTGCTGCWQWVSQAYGTFPATLAAGGTYNNAPAYYLTVQ
jgi:hypothetical protein